MKTLPRPYHEMPQESSKDKVALNLSVHPDAKPGLERLAKQYGYSSRSAFVEAVGLEEIALASDTADGTTRKLIAQAMGLLGQAIGMQGRS